MEPKISVIVPVYNVEKYLEECLDSIINQTLKEIEIICVNDGSTDSSAKLLKKYAAADKRLKIITQENGGLSKARNSGMQVAKGKYIAFVDSDDFIAVDMMERLYNKAEKTNSEICVGNIFLYFHDSKEKIVYRDQKLYLYLKNKVFNLEEYPEFLCNIAAWDRIYLRSFLEQVHAKFPEGLIYEDAFFTSYTLSCAKKISVVPDALYYYRKNAGNSITDNEKKSQRSRSDFIEINKRIQNHFEDKNVSSQIWESYYMYFLHNAYMHQMNCKKYSEFSEYFFQVKRLMGHKEFKNIDDSLNENYKKYVKALHNGHSCRFYLRKLRKQYVYRNEKHIYFRLSVNGKAHKII